MRDMELCVMGVKWYQAKKKLDETAKKMFQFLSNSIKALWGSQCHIMSTQFKKQDAQKSIQKVKTTFLD